MLIFCFDNSDPDGFGAKRAAAVCEDGAILVNAVCASEADIWSTLQSTRSQALYDEHCGPGPGWEMIIVDEPENDPRVRSALALATAARDDVKHEP